jgi:hypothetical protein
MTRKRSAFRLAAALLALLLAGKAGAQSPPVLQLTNFSGSNVTVSWPASASNYVLVTTRCLSQPCTWASVSPFALGNPTLAVVPTTNALQFFRLGQAYPLFQFAVFYNADLDLSPGEPMTINGKVFSNGNIWLWPYATLTFNGTVSAVGTVYNQVNPSDQQTTNGYVPPVYNGGQPVSQVASLGLLIAATNNTPTNVAQIILDPPPPGENPNSFLGQGRLYNQTDLVISNSVSSNITVYFQNPASPNRLTLVTNDVTIGTNKYYSFATNVAFYDYRESDTVKAVQIDVARLNLWLTNTATGGGNYWNTQNLAYKGHGINSIYVYDGVSLGGTNLPAVRLVNGQQLPPSGLTVATPQPLYIKGNYNIQTNSGGGSSFGTTNTAYTYPASLMGDAITVLSTNWNDKYNSATNLSQRSAANTTINTSLLVGFVPSVTVGTNKYYSGGLENLPRMMESWTSCTLTYNGSMTAMFYSRWATNYWQTPGNYYEIPTRNWGFDANFMQLNRLPPLTPWVANLGSP